MKIRFLGSICLSLAFVAVSRAQDSQLSVGKLIESLAMQDVDERREAAYELTRRQVVEPKAIEAMGQALSDDDNQVRFQCLLGLAHAGPHAEPAIDALIEQLSDRDAQIRYRAGDALGKIGMAALPKLIEAWKSKLAAPAQIEAARAFAVIGSPATAALPLLAEALDASTEELALCSAEAIVAIIPNDMAAMLDIATRKTASVRAIGATALGTLKDPPAQVYEQLAASIKDPDPLVREAAFIALAKSTLPTKHKMSFVLQALLDSSPSMRAAAMIVLRPAGLATPAFAKKIAGELPAAEGEQLNSLIRALGSLGTVAVDTLPDLLTAAEREPTVNRDLLAQTLADVGRERLPVLLTAIQNDPGLERVVAQAFAHIGEAALPTLLAGLASPSELVRTVSIRGLGSMPNPSDEVLKRLSQGLQDSQASVRAATIETLVDNSLISATSQPGFVKALQDPDPTVRSFAVLGLPDLAQSAGAEFSQMIERCLKDPSERVRANTLLSLSRMDELPEQLVPLVVTLSQNEAAEVRRQAVGAMAKLKDQLKDEPTKQLLRNALIKALGDADNRVRIQATQAVVALDLTDPQILQALSNNLVDDIDLLRETLEAIAGFGHGAQELAPSISRLVDHELAEIRTAAVGVLVAVEGNQASLVQRLTEALDDMDIEVRKVAAIELGELGERAKEAVPKLFRMLERETDSDFASGALREIDTAPVDAIALLLTGLDSDDRRTSFYSVSLLGKIGPPAREALPQLEKLLAEPSTGRSAEFRRRLVTEAIAAIKAEKLDDQ